MPKVLLFTKVSSTTDGLNSASTAVALALRLGGVKTWATDCPTLATRWRSHDLDFRLTPFAANANGANLDLAFQNNGSLLMNSFALHIRSGFGTRRQVPVLALALGLALGSGLATFSPWARAQAPGHPNVNAQLLVGARQSDLVQVQRNLAQGAAPNSRNRLGKTALWIAADKGLDTMAEQLLAAGADVNLASLEGVTPLMAACYNGHTAVVQRLLAVGARKELLDQRKKPAAVYAAGQGHVGALAALIEAGVDVNAAYDNQLTALMWAAGQGQVDAVKWLLQRGAKRELKDDRGLNAADMARQGGHAAVVALLGG
jgi:uncharacterized protein